MNMVVGVATIMVVVMEIVGGRDGGCDDRLWWHTKGTI